MKYSKCFGRKLRIPSKLEIRRKLMMMGLADKLISDLRSNKIEENELVSILRTITAQHDITPRVAKNISDLYRKRHPAMSTKADRPVRESDYRVSG